MGKVDAIESSKKIVLQKELLRIDKNECLKISRNFQNGKYDNIRNYYKEAKDSGYLDKDRYDTYAKELNHILWIFLFANKKSRTDLEVLDASIEIFNQSANTTLKEEDPVLKYLNNNGHKTYFEFSKYFNDKYGINIREYKDAKINGLKINNKNIFDDESLSENKPVFSSTQIYDIIVSILDEHKEEFLISEDYGYSLLKKETRSKLIYPIYKQSYKLPVLQAIGSSKVVFESFSGIIPRSLGRHNNV